MKKLIFLLIFVAGCHYVNPSSYNHKLAAWLGHSQESLFQALGQPQEQYSVDADTHIVIYTYSSHEPLYGERHPYQKVLDYGALAGPRYGYSQVEQEYYCQTTFTIRNGVVVDYAFNGDDCI